MSSRLIIVLAASMGLCACSARPGSVTVLAPAAPEVATAAPPPS